MKRQKLPVATSLAVSVLMALTPLTTWATGDDTPSEPIPLAPVIITEVQTRSTSATNAAYEEFIELYNTTDQPVDFETGRWKILIAAKDALNWDTAASVTLAGSLAPGASYIVGSIRSGVVYPVGSAVWFTAGLADDGGHVRLVYSALDGTTPDNCVPAPTVVDQVEWSRKTSSVATYPSLDGRSVFLTGTTAGITAGNSLQRVLDQSSLRYKDRDNDGNDFAAAAPTQGLPSVVTETVDPGIPPQAAVQLPEDTCPVNDAEPDPSAGDPEPLPADDDSPPAVIETPEPEADDSDTTPQPAIPAANVGLKQPLLSELLPNPAPPQTDQDDEFIELYNPNDAYFDMSGYVLEVGLTTKHHYAIPAGVSIPPRTFLAFFSAQTGLAMSNSGGQATLLDPLGRILLQSDAYSAAKDGQAWVLAGGIWQWTIKPTPNAVNVVSAPAVKSKSTAKKTATITIASAKKTGGGGQSSTGVDPQEDVGQAAAVAASSSTPLHPGVLALIAVSAVLYGAYEYRRDVANRIYRFRADRAARRAFRRSAEGR